ncbi:ketosteroid isomerase-related protein [Notoacmeibacter sp. MSK16QG-6]|uniref:ketosteroid isomerase-related protein n=1 Tax=Notoacmeibacter sp. MSK16QG-6 TaxID=2957982 RepID=UPI00209D3485|nr:ketosteroid isomerase-related protein [Notoacmeibacter sp. MSK16QG-6]MCP1199816.1 nuclear transport factor 2 family protein [Notoacmeibacter sp. MSK16QG-6]
MSAEQTRQLIDNYLNRFNASDWDGMTALVGEDVAHDINQGDRQIGREAFHRFLVENSRYYDEQLGDVVVMTDESGRRGAAEVTVRGRYIATAPGQPDASDQSYSLRAGIFFELDSGAISRVTTYYNMADWQRQVEGG